MRNHDHDEPGEAQRERGVALIMVAIFGIGAIVLASTLLTVSTLGITDSAERHGNKTLSAVVQAGIAAAVYEINHDLRNGPYDPEGDGVGALGCDDGLGVELVVDGQSLGFYRTTIEKDASDRKILTVVAAYPNFTSPRRTSGAQVIVSAGTPPFLSDRNALSVVGPVTSGDNSNLHVTNGAQLTISDPANSVPAVNIESADVHAVLGPKLVSAGTISGGDTNNPGSGATGAGTIDNSSGGVLLENDVTTIATNIQSYVNGLTPTSLVTAVVAAGGASSSSDVIDTGATIPNGVYEVNGDLDIKGSITGSGTLIIRTNGDKVVLKNGTFDWTGDVIVIGNDSEIEIESGTRFNVTGNLAIVTIGSDVAEVDVFSGGRLNVTGTLMDLNTSANNNDDEGLDLNSGSRANIDGLYLGLGNSVYMQSQSGSRLNVNGSMVLAIPQDISDTSQFSMEMHVHGGGRTNLIFDNTNFTNAVDTLGDFLKKAGADDFIPVANSGYWEAGGASGLLSAQQTRINNSDPLGFNQ